MLDTRNTVLLVIDVQEKLSRLVHQRDMLLGNLQKLIRGIQVLEIPVIVTEQYPQGLGPTVKEISSLLAGFHPLTKTSFSCCGDSGFTLALERLGRKQVLVTGIEGHVCVYQTTADLVNAGYEAYVVTDCISSFKSLRSCLATHRPS